MPQTTDCTINGLEGHTSTPQRARGPKGDCSNKTKTAASSVGGENRPTLSNTETRNGNTAHSVDTTKPSGSNGNDDEPADKLFCFSMLTRKWRAETGQS